MPTRLEGESTELAARFGSAGRDDRHRVAAQAVERARASQHPPLELPAARAALEALFDELDASEDEADFRRARAASAALALCDSAYDDALYEALHARRSIPEAVGEALDDLA